MRLDPEKRDDVRRAFGTLKQDLNSTGRNVKSLLVDFFNEKKLLDDDEFMDFRIGVEMLLDDVQELRDDIQTLQEAISRWGQPSPKK